MREVSASVSGVLTTFLERRGVVGAGIGFLIDLSFLTIAAFLLAKLIWTILSPAAFVTVPVTAVSLPGASNNVVFRADPNILERFNPFDRNLSSADNLIVEDAPETTLNLKIRLLFASTEADQSLVRLELPDGKVQRFNVGDTVVQGVTIERILSDRIILLRRGEREVLYASERRVIDLVTPDGEPVVDPSPKTEISGALPSDRAINAAELGVDFEDVYNRIIFRSVAGQDGRPVLKIFAGSDKTLLDQLGLKQNDSVLSVNGHDLRQESLADLYETLKDEDKLDFVIEREGQTARRTISIGNDVGETNE